MNAKTSAPAPTPAPALAIAALLAMLVIWTAWGNTAVQLNKQTVLSDCLPEGFDGYRIAHISDLHNAEMGNDNENLLAAIEEAAPDIIVITGDLIDSRATNIEIALRFAEGAAQIAPCYYVSGNHEARVANYADLKSGLTELGVNVLENERTTLRKSSDEIILIGVNDPSFETDYLLGDAESAIKNSLSNLTREEDGFTLLLSHRPELFDVYAEMDVDLALSGHAHGGQFRLPFVGGIVAPGQGLFPKYTEGLYAKDGTSMVVSRGIGNSIIPFRFSNRPEVVLVELQRETS